MQKQIELTDKTVLVVGLPENKPHHLSLVNNVLWYRFERIGCRSFSCVQLPQGDWQLVGIHPEITEEECNMVVEKSVMYKDYIKTDDLFEDYSKETAKEAFDTLMQKLECYTVNPYGNFECPNQWCEDGYIDQGYGDKWRCDFCQENEDKLDEAEQSTFAKFAVLIKNK